MATNDSIGEKGRKNLNDALKLCPKDLPTAITNFRQENSILVPSLKSALGLFDLFGTSRHSYYLAAAEALRDKFIEHLHSLEGQADASEKLNDYVSRYCSLAIDVPLLRPVIFTAANIVPALSDDVIEKLTEPSLFNQCPVELKQKIFEVKPTLFKSTLLKLVATYIKTVESSLRSEGLCGTTSFTSVDIVSLFRKHPSVNEITNLVGNSKILYKSMKHNIDQIFERTENDIVCTLKQSLILSIDGASEILRHSDPLYKASWCIDTCVRNRSIEQKQAKQLQTICESIKDLGSLSIVIADPLFVFLACKRAVSLTYECADLYTLPRYVTSVQFLVFLLKLGMSNFEKERIIFLTSFNFYRLP